MAHHGSNRMDDSEIAKIFGKPGTKMTGATGQFPEGKLTATDEGEIRLLVGEKDGKVVIDFGTPTTWIGFTAEQALEIANLLKVRALEIQLRPR